MSQPWKTLLTGSAVVAAATLVSRILGFVRDLALAERFGTHPAVDSFLQAFRVVDWVVFLLAGGGAAAALVPILTGLKVSQGMDAAWSGFRKILQSAAAVLFGLVLLGELTAPWSATWVGPGFSEHLQSQTMVLIRILMPSMFFLGLSALCGAALNMAGSFIWPPLAWAVMDLGILAGILWQSPDAPPHLAMQGVSLGLVLGSAGALALQLLALGRLGFRWQRRPSPQADLTTLAWRKFWPAAWVLLLGYSYFEIAAALASNCGDGWVTSLRYSARLINFPQGLVGMALAVVLLPMLSQAHSRGLDDEYRRLLRRASFLALAVGLSALLVVQAFSLPMVQLLFQRGNFQLQDSLRLASLLVAMAWALPANLLVLLLTQACYAQGRLRWPILAQGLPLLPVAVILWRAAERGDALAMAWTLGIYPWISLLVLAFSQWPGSGRHGGPDMKGHSANLRNIPLWPKCDEPN